MPLGDVEMLTQSFNVGDKVPGCVVCGVGIRARLTTTSLVEQDHPVFRGVEEDGVGFRAIPAGSAMEEDDWLGLDIKKFGWERCCSHQVFHPSCQTADSIVHGRRRRAANSHPKHLHAHSR